MGLDCHDPFLKKSDKAEYGCVDNGFVFLGYDIRPGLFQPSQKAKEKLEKVIEGHIYLGRKAIADVKKADNSFEGRQRYAQTLVLIDKVVRGWGEAFAYGNAPYAKEDLDKKIDGHLYRFRNWFSSQLSGQGWKTKRRLGGVCLLGDIQPKNLDDVPFVLQKAGRVVRSSSMVTISTDGSIAVHTARKGKDQGPGGWAIVEHGTGEVRSGHVLSATNNQMELRAVIEAIRFADPKKSLLVRTDSRYVENAINRQSTIKSNANLWREYCEVSKDRRVKVVWVKGHFGDEHNERADQLAAEQAKLAKTILSAKVAA